MAFTCMSCRRRFSGKPTKSFTGRDLCERCNGGILAAAAGAVAAAPSDTTSGRIIGGLSTAGWYQRIKDSRARVTRKGQQDAAAERTARLDAEPSPERSEP